MLEAKVHVLLDELWAQADQLLECHPQFPEFMDLCALS